MQNEGICLGESLTQYKLMLINTYNAYKDSPAPSDESFDSKSREHLQTYGKGLLWFNPS